MLPSLTYQSDFYRLISGALLNSNGRYESLEVYFRDELSENAFPTTKWSELLEVADENPSGEYMQVIGTNSYPVMANYVSDDSEGQLMSNAGFSLNKDTMPIMRRMLNFNEKSVRDGQYLMERGGMPDYQRIFNSFNKDASDLIATLHMLRSFSTLQVESTGKLLTDSENNAGGIQGLEIDFSRYAPTENRKKCGGFANKAYPSLGTKFPWTDEKAYPIGDLRDMYNYYRKVALVPFRGVFRMNADTFGLLVNHPSTMMEVKVWKTGALASAENLVNYVITNEDINEYLSTRLGLPVISVEDWYGITSVLDPATQKIVKSPQVAFADGVVVLRPEGKFGELQWTRPSSLFATPINPMYYADGGKIGVRQIIDSKVRSMQFIAESRGIPVPRNIDYFLYLDITKAAN